MNTAAFKAGFLQLISDMEQRSEDSKGEYAARFTTLLEALILSVKVQAGNTSKHNGFCFRTARRNHSRRFGALKKEVMKGKGILIDNDYNLQVLPVRGTDGKIISGLCIGDTLRQNQGLILILQPAEIKLSPLVGVAIEDIVLDNDFLGWRRTIRQQMELDGQEVRKVSFSVTQNLIIDAKYSNR